MDYLVAVLIFVVVFLVFIKLLKSLIKGCLTALFILAIVGLFFVMMESTKRPVRIFGLYEVYNFEFRKL